MDCKEPNKCMYFVNYYLWLIIPSAHWHRSPLHSLYMAPSSLSGWTNFVQRLSENHTQNRYGSNRHDSSNANEFIKLILISTFSEIYKLLYYLFWSDLRNAINGKHTECAQSACIWIKLCEPKVICMVHFTHITTFSFTLNEQI